MPLFDEEDLELFDDLLPLLLEHFDPPTLLPKPTSSLKEEDDLEDFVFFPALVEVVEAPVTVGAGAEEEVEGEAVVVSP